MANPADSESREAPSTDAGPPASEPGGQTGCCGGPAPKVPKAAAPWTLSSSPKAAPDAAARRR